MTITLPKPLRTYQYRPLTVFSLLDTDTDRVLPQLFEMCVKGGRSSRSRTDAGDFTGYRDKLLRSESIVGYIDQDQSLLDGWLRTCVVDMGAVGRSHSGQQMLAVAPLTLAAYRAGLPKDRSRHAGIDDFAYQALVAEMGRTGSGNAVANLRDLVVRTVGRGLAIGSQPRWEPILEDPSQLDIGALLELRFLEGFDMADARAIDDGAADSPLPAVSKQIGSGLLAHLQAYGEVLPTQSLMSGFAALLATDIYTFTLRADAGGRELLRSNGALPPDMQPNEPVAACALELYCDLTGDLGSASDRLARRCVERDLDRTRLAFRDRMTFVVIEQALNRMAGEKAQFDVLDRPGQLGLLASLRGHRRVESYCEARLDDLVADAEDNDSTTETEIDFLRAVQGQDRDELDKLLDVLQYVNESKALKNSVGWLRSVGGLTKPYGLLDGVSTNRRSWRYAPSDEQLTALLLALFVDSDGASYRRTMSLQQVLDGLRDRWGILVDRPPEFLDGAEARAAATANLEAFKRRLQLLGCFDSLSDDFSVQTVRHPLGDA